MDRIRVLRRPVCRICIILIRIQDVNKIRYGSESRQKRYGSGSREMVRIPRIRIRHTGGDSWILIVVESNADPRSDLHFNVCGST